MKTNLVMTGDLNLLGIDDPAVPFAKLDALREADIAIGNLECCLFDPPQQREMMADDVSGYEGFYVPSAAGQALKLGGYKVVGNANNQNYGAEAILASNKNLDALGIAHAGTGRNSAEARAPAVVTHNRLKVGFVQRTSQYWSNNHEAGARAPGVATLKAYTAYQPPYYKDNKIPPNRPGAPAKVITWTDPEYLAQFRDEIAALRRETDFVVSSHHWGYGEEVLQYMKEIAHAAIDSGADVVMGHGPHYPLAIEVYKGKPIFYGMGSFCFMRTNKKLHRGWIGMMPKLALDDSRLSRVAFSFVRQAEDTSIAVQDLAREKEQVDRIARLSGELGTKGSVKGNDFVVQLEAA